MTTMMHFTNVKWKGLRHGPEEFYYSNDEHPNDVTRAVTCLQNLEHDTILSFQVKMGRVITANKEK